MNDSAPLDAALAAWQAEQRLRGGYTPSELEELTDHVASSAAELTPTAAERVQLAAQRVGARGELAHEFERVRGVRLETLAFSPAGLLSAGALLWFFAQGMTSSIKLVVASASLWLFPRAVDEAILIAYIVSLSSVALFALVLSSERTSRAISVRLRTRPWHLLGICAVVACMTLAATAAGRIALAQIAGVETFTNVLIGPFYDSTVANHATWALVPLLLFIASRRAARRAASAAALGQIA